jgi:hypothetical protein
MTHIAPRKRGGRTWILPAATTLIIAGLVVFRVLSTSLVTDVVSWWSVWVVLVGLWLWARGRKLGAFRLGGLVSVAAVGVAALLVVGHIQGWAIMPSSAGLLNGSSDSGFTSAGLSARAPGGVLVVATGSSGTLYAAQPVRRGGDIAAPFAVERSQDADVSVVLSPSDDAGLFLWAGWRVSLSPLPAWTLTLEGNIDADLSGLVVENLQLLGTGSVRLGPVEHSTPLTVSGDFVIDVPGGIPVRVVGPAEIPSDWERTDAGAASPVDGQGWVISVADGTVVEIRVR